MSVFICCGHEFVMCIRDWLVVMRFEIILSSKKSLLVSLWNSTRAFNLSFVTEDGDVWRIQLKLLLPLPQEV